MNDLGDYPLGAHYDYRAPYNKHEPESREFSITCSQTLSKDVSVVTDNYTPIAIKEYEDGEWILTEEYDTSDTDWDSEYHENDHYTPEQLIVLFKQYLIDELEGTSTTVKTPEHLKWLIEECSGWMDAETIITE